MIRFGDCVPSFRNGSDSPRALLERCIDAIEGRDDRLAALARWLMETLG